MQTMTAEEFQEAVALDPAWASKLTEPVEITGYCDIGGSKITHLSPLLTFTGRNKDGDCASFGHCHNLKIAEGTFHGWVDFKESGIEKIGNLTITQPDNNGKAASFWGCPNLKIAEGTFPGWVNFEESGIEKIGDLTITRPDIDGDAVSFYGCKHLQIAEGTFPGFVNFQESGIEKIGELTITQPDKFGDAVSFYGCKHLQIAEGNFPGYVVFCESGIQSLGSLHCEAADLTDCKFLKSGNPKTIQRILAHPETVIDPETKARLEQILKTHKALQQQKELTI